VRCRHCGSENPGIHRFCGMCGKPLEEETPFGKDPAAEDALAEMGPVGPPGSVQPAKPEPPTPAPAYTGGIFNLGASGERPSRNLDYLLEDDEPQSHKGLLLVGVVAVALVLGLGWLRFRHGGFPGLGSSTTLKAPAGQNADGTIPSSSSSPSDNSSAPSTKPSSVPSSGTGDQGNGSAGASAASSAPAAQTVGAAVPAGSNPAAASPPPAPPVATVPTSNGSPTPAPGSAPETAASSGGTSAADAGAATPQSGSESGAAPSPVGGRSGAPATAAATPAGSPEVPAPANPKKVAKPAPAKPEDTVALGEKYLYGRGVPQSCEKGLSYVKPAAERSNAKAMITMGALYATGHCLSRDLPTAYRYFALALRQDPENGPLKQNAEMVWGQMTPSERQLAIRMTQ
jgi:TPR repeat protein